ncbi:hypothetical protein VNI00_014808 [Paramarasmius palmivorus]|uniref:Uncharacterized protein n=1 Tax=Paramarasmius palmivorus TaxID=297713 RepID=A0AAW0BS05_9AGAR
MEFKSKYEGKNDEEILVEQIKTWANTSTYNHYNMGKIDIITEGGVVKYRFWCKIQPSTSIVQARYNNSTSNLARHVQLCTEKVIPSNQAITQYTNGCNYDHRQFHLETTFWMAESAHLFLSIKDK